MFKIAQSHDRRTKQANSEAQAHDEVNMGSMKAQGSTITLTATAGCNKKMHVNTRSTAKRKKTTVQEAKQGKLGARRSRKKVF